MSHWHTSSSPPSSVDLRCIFVSFRLWQIVKTGTGTGKQVHLIQRTRRVRTPIRPLPLSLSIMRGKQNCHKARKLPDTCLLGR